MKVSDIFSYSIKNVLRNKKNIFYILVLIFCTVILLISLVFNKNLKNFINESIYKNVGFRTLNVQLFGEQDEIKNIKEIKYVSDIYSSQYGSVFVDTTLKSDKYDGVLELLYLDDSLSENILHNQNYIKDNYLICPSNFFPSSEAGLGKIGNNDILNGEDYRGKNINVTYSSYKLGENMSIIVDKSYQEEFTIIGVYDNEKYMNITNQCYANNDKIKEIVDAKSSINNGMTVYAHSVVVDKVEHIKYVMNVLTELGYENIETKNQIDYEFVNKIDVLCSCIIILIFISIFFITILYVNKKKNEDMFNIGILKVSGCNDCCLLKINFIENFIIIGIEFFISIILFIILFLIAKYFLFYNLTYLGFKINFEFIDILKIFISVFFITTIISSYFEKKNLKKSISKLMESE